MNLSPDQRLVIERMLINIVNVLRKFLMSLPLGVLAGIAAWIIMCIYQSRNSIVLAKEKKISIVLFFIYVFILFQVTILLRPIGSVNDIDLIPFDTYGGTGYIVLYAAINAIVFIPLGILVPVIWNKMASYTKIALIGFSVSLLIEICQLVLRCGVFQTEDMIMNTVGSIIGYWIFTNLTKNSSNRLSLK